MATHKPLVIIAGQIQQLKDGQQLGTNLRPLVIINGEIQQLKDGYHLNSAKPLVIIAGQIQQLPSGDTLAILCKDYMTTITQTFNFGKDDTCSSGSNTPRSIAIRVNTKGKTTLVSPSNESKSLRIQGILLVATYTTFALYEGTVNETERQILPEINIPQLSYDTTIFLAAGKSLVLDVIADAYGNVDNPVLGTLTWWEE